MNWAQAGIVVIDMGGGYGGVPFTTLESNGIEPVAYKGEYENERGVRLWQIGKQPRVVETTRGRFIPIVRNREF